MLFQSVRRKITQSAFVRGRHDKTSNQQQNDRSGKKTPLQSTSSNEFELTLQLTISFYDSGNPFDG